ncbi:MAG TPA: methyltransferase domain-containing protein [Burkholderiaceae bacterium]|nr:methyltransferase domain-containing protein [Burkholderiaceae bacterium]HRA78709.1 methyltransferase domain-containing protein [Burkholderiaceae bacterium]
MSGAATRGGPSVAFWQERFASQRTPWDRGAVNPALAPLLEAGQLPAGARVLVPGCGAGYEVETLAAAGFRPIGVDYAPTAVGLTRARLAQAGLDAEVIEADLLEWAPSAPVDAVWEQACLCALHPDLWVAYAQRLASWVVHGGTLVLLAVQVERDGRREGRIEGPPYHCDVNAVRALFPADAWDWPRPPYLRQVHPAGFAELQIVLKRTAA